jgi:proteic killer suppression protein
VTIETFKHKGLEELFVNGKTRRIGNKSQRKIIELMDIIDAATELKDLQGISAFHPLKGGRKGAYSMTVTGNWRITFTFADGEAHILNYEDYR